MIRPNIFTLTFLSIVVLCFATLGARRAHAEMITQQQSLYGHDAEWLNAIFIAHGAVVLDHPGAKESGAQEINCEYVRAVGDYFCEFKAVRASTGHLEAMTSQGEEARELYLFLGQMGVEGDAAAGRLKLFSGRYPLRNSGFHGPNRRSRGGPLHGHLFRLAGRSGNQSQSVASHPGGSPSALTLIWGRRVRGACYLQRLDATLDFMGRTHTRSVKLALFRALTGVSLAASVGAFSPVARAQSADARYWSPGASCTTLLKRKKNTRQWEAASPDIFKDASPEVIILNGHDAKAGSFIFVPQSWSTDAYVSFEFKAAKNCFRSQLALAAAPAPATPDEGPVDPSVESAPRRRFRWNAFLVYFKTRTPFVDNTVLTSSDLDIAQLGAAAGAHIDYVHAKYIWGAALSGLVARSTVDSTTASGTQVNALTLSFGAEATPYALYRITRTFDAGLAVGGIALYSMWATSQTGIFSKKLSLVPEYKLLFRYRNRLQYQLEVGAVRNFSHIFLAAGVNF